MKRNNKHIGTILSIVAVGAFFLLVLFIFRGGASGAKYNSAAIKSFDFSCPPEKIAPCVNDSTKKCISQFDFDAMNKGNSELECSPADNPECQPTIPCP